MVHIVSFVSCGSPNPIVSMAVWFCKCHLFKKQDACWAYTPAILGVCRFAAEIDVGGLIYVEMICNRSNH